MGMRDCENTDQNGSANSPLVGEGFALSCSMSRRNLTGAAAA